MENLDNSSMLSSIENKDNDSNERDKIKRAYELYSSGKYSEAISLLENDSSCTRDSYAQVLLGNCYKQSRNTQKAMSSWQKAIEISPLEHTAYINIGSEYFAAGNISEAILNWQRACSIYPENPAVNLNLAIAYDKKNSRIKATNYFERYLKYEKNTSSSEYNNIKRTIAKLKAQTEFYAQKLVEVKTSRNLQGIAAIYLKMISTYANLPAVYNNIAEIFYFDKNYERALEFYLVLYLNYPHTVKVLLEIANLCYLLQHKSYAYAYYKKALALIPEKTSHYSKVLSKVNSLSSVRQETELVNSHLEKAHQAELNNEYEVAIDEYENYMILSEIENEQIKQTVDKYKIFLNPEPFVISVLYSQIPDLMQRKKLNACVEVCDRIITLSNENTKEVVYAMRCKSECKRIIAAQGQFSA